MLIKLGYRSIPLCLDIDIGRLLW